MIFIIGISGSETNVEIEIYDLRGKVVGTHPRVRSVNANANDRVGEVRALLLLDPNLSNTNTYLKCKKF